MKKYRVGIVGCGAIFDRHIEAIETNKENFELVSLCDINQRKLDIRSKEYKVLGFTKYEDMLKEMKEKMNMVVIATPNSLHKEQAIAAINLGYNIIVEKPIAFKSKEVREVSDLAKEKGVEAYAILQVRYNPTLNLLEQAMRKQLIGHIRSVSLIQRWQRPSEYFDTWRSDPEIGGRTLFEVGIHYLDIVQKLFGVPQVTASTTFNNKHLNVAFEDTVFAILKFPSGASGSLEVTIAAEPKNLECSLCIMGSTGFIKVGGRALDLIEEAKFNTKLQEDVWNTLANDHNKSLEPNSYGAYAGSCPNHPTLYKEIAEGRGISVEQAINSVQFIENVYEKETNKK